MDILILILLVIGIIAWFVLRGQGYRGSQDKVIDDDEFSSAPEIQVKVTTRTRSSSSRSSQADSGRITSFVDGEYVINPKSALPLTITNTDRETAKKLKTFLDKLGDRYYARENLDELTALVARSNLHCKELDWYCEEYRPKYLEFIEARKSRGGTPWDELSELDREDVLTELRKEAARSLDLIPSDRVDDELLVTLFLDEPSDSTIDDSLIDKFGFQNMQFYFSLNDKAERVHKVPADAWHRKSFEALASVGLARRGREIPLENILQGLTLKQLNDLKADPTTKRFTRKAQAVEQLREEDCIEDRVSQVVAYRELFQLASLPQEYSDVPMKAVAAAWRYARVVAQIIATTYRAGTAAITDRQEWVDESTEMQDDIRGWELSLREDEAPAYCKRFAKEVATSKSFPKLPAHIGCGCHAYPRYRDNDDD